MWQAAGDGSWKIAPSPQMQGKEKLDAWQGFKPVVLTPLRVEPFGTLSQGHLRLSKNKYICIMTDNSIKSTVMRYQQKQFYDWGSTQHEELHYRITALGRLRTTALNVLSMPPVTYFLQQD